MPPRLALVDHLPVRSKDNPDGVLFREFSLQVTARAAADGESERIEIAISSETPVLRWDYRKWEPYYEVLDHSPGSIDLSYVRDGIPFCLDHSLAKQIGLGENTRLDADRIFRTEVMQGHHPDAGWAFADIKAGVRKKVSVGYDPGDAYVETKAEGETIPTRRYTKWMPYEVSTVTVPADYEVGVGRDGAQGAAPPKPLPAARAAKPARSPEGVMEDDEITPGGGAGTATEKKPSRASLLAQLARQYKDLIPGERLAEWIENGTTVDAARESIMATLAEKARNAPQIATSTQVTEVRDRAEDKPWEADEFIRSVVNAARHPDAIDVRLRAQRSQNTQTGTDGGFAVPTPVLNVILEAQKTGGEILSRVTERPVTVGNAVKETLVKEEARTNGSRNGGLRAYWVAQEGSITESQAKLRELELNVKKVAAAIPVTEEQIEDGPQLISFLKEQVPEELKFVKELAIWDGTGAGSPLGFMRSGALITQAIEGTQTIANTSEFIWKNAAKMMTRMSPSAFLRAAFFINPALWADIVTATAGAAANGATTLYTPPGRLESMPFGGIYGRPIVPVEYASAVGTVGDFVLADLSDYLFAQKGGLRFAQSMHVEFLKDKQTLRFIERVDGQPRTRVPMTPLNGSVTVSPYVALAARA
jgi:HK97 family phage major capsid protein